ncbi:MAG: TIGR02466 family protein [Pseudomonadota bacterium]
MTTNGASQATIKQAFAAPIIQYQWEDTHELNAQLREYALQRMDHEAGQIISNVGGWSSKKDILQNSNLAELNTLSAMAETLLRELMQRCLAEVDDKLLIDWEANAWFNVNNPGGYNELHNHGRPPSVWSGIYYVDCGTDDPTQSGRTVFENCHTLPRPGRQRFDFAKAETVTPNPGLMLIFPSSFFHRVETHRGNRPRITVAFNFSHPLMSLSTGALEEFLRSKDQSGQRSNARLWMWRNFAGIMKIHRKFSRVWRS